MPEYRVIRIVHESKIIDAPNEDTAVARMADYGSGEVEAEVNDTYAEELV